MALPKKDNKVIDTGSGTGNLTVELAKKVAPNGLVMAIEPVNDRYTLAKNTHADVY